MLIGIDISHHNQNMKDLNDLKTLDFVIMKASEGVRFRDPAMRKYIDYLAYVVIDQELQLERIKTRNNFNDFIEKWIPREEEYFKSFDFVVNADILI